MRSHAVALASASVVLVAGSARADEPCGPKPAAIRLATAGLDAVRTKLAPKLLVGCAPARYLCAADDSLEETRGCAIELTPSPEGAIVVVRPAPAEGAPGYVLARLDAAGKTAATIDVAETQWRAAAKSKVWVLAHQGSASHEHGGSAASVGEITVAVDNRGRKPAKITVSRVDWMTSTSCDDPLERVASPAFEGLELDDKPVATGPAVIRPRRRSYLGIRFAPQHAYQAWCDRFAARVALDVDGTAIEVTAPIRVTRYEPMER